MRGRTNVTQREGATVNGVVRDFTVASGSSISIGDFVQYKLNKNYKSFTSAGINIYEEHNYSGNKYVLLGKIDSQHVIYLVEAKPNEVEILDFTTLPMTSSNDLAFFANGDTVYISVTGIIPGSSQTVQIYEYSIVNDTLQYSTMYSGSFGYTDAGWSSSLRGIGKIGNQFVLVLSQQKTSSSYDYGIVALMYSISGNSIQLQDYIRSTFGTSTRAVYTYSCKCSGNGIILYGCIYREGYETHAFTISTTGISQVQVTSGSNPHFLCKDNILLISRGSGLYLYYINNNSLVVGAEKSIPVYSTTGASIGIVDGKCCICFNMTNQKSAIYLFYVDSLLGQVDEKSATEDGTGYYGEYNNVCIFNLAAGKVYQFLSGSSESTKYFMYTEELDYIYFGEYSNYVESYNGQKALGFAKTAGSSGQSIEVYTPT